MAKAAEPNSQCLITLLTNLTPSKQRRSTLRALRAGAVPLLDSVRSIALFPLCQLMSPYR